MSTISMQRTSDKDKYKTVKRDSAKNKKAVNNSKSEESEMKWLTSKCTVGVCLIFIITVIMILVFGNIFGETVDLQHSLSIDPMEVTQKTVTPKLPGIYHMNKVYNMFIGKHLYEQLGVDVISYQFNGRYTSDGADAWEIPIEFRSVPPIEASCDVTATVNNVYYSSSQSILEEQAKSVSEGFSATVDLKVAASYKAVEVEAATQMQFGLMYGHSSTSRSAKNKVSTGYQYSFSLDSKNTYYRAEIDWNGDNDFNFQWTAPFLARLKSLDNNPSNQSILLFLHDWGSHVLTKMQTGSYCTETAYIDGQADERSIYDFRQTVDTESTDWAFWSQDKTETNTNVKAGTWNNEVAYQFSNIECVGEVKVAHSSCATSTSTTTNPIAISYELLRFWDIEDVKNRLSDQSLKNIESFFDYLFFSLQECSDEHCNGRGVCILSEEIWSTSFINEWNGRNFSDLWNMADNQYCFCENDVFGADCNDQMGCNCFETTGCCCKDNQCIAGNLCSPDDTCIAANSYTNCGLYGDFIECNGGRGVVFGACGSGTEANCANTGFCGADEWNGIFCGYEELGAWTGTTDDWNCFQYGVEFSCQTSTHGGDLMVGLCGSGTGIDCQSQCNGWNGVLCASIEDVVVNVSTCVWIDGYDWNSFVSCPDGFVATGYCGSGTSKDCETNNIMNNIKLQCCELM